MTENPRTALLQRARHRTAAILIGTMAGTGLLTVGIAATAQQAAGHDSGTPRATTDDNSESTSGDSSESTSDDSSGRTSGTSDAQPPSGVSSGTGSGTSDGGTHSS